MFNRLTRMGFHRVAGKKIIQTALLVFVACNALVVPAQPGPGTLYQVPSPAAFDVNKLEPQTQVLYRAFLKGWASGKFAPEIDKNVFSDGYPDKIDLYGIRGPKTYQNFIKAFLEEGIRDPYLIEIIYQLTKPLLTRFETGYLLWPENEPLPGAAQLTDGVLRVTDRYASDYNRVYGESKDIKSAWSRRRAWGYRQDGEWGNHPTAEERKSPKYKRAVSSGRKKILYLNEMADTTSITAYGTINHALDMLLGTQHVFWAGYMLDVNKHLDPRYGQAADVIWDYKTNHWEKDAPEVMGERHPVYKFYSKPSTLHHANDAHTSLFHVNVLWHALREGKPRPDDVTALRYLMQTILDDIYLVPVPPQAPQAGQYKGTMIANYSHWNQAANRLLGQKTNYRPGDMTYDRERAGTLLSLMHGKVKGTSGKTLTDAHLEAMSNLHALIVEQDLPAGTRYWLPNDASGSESTGITTQCTQALLNNGSTAAGFQYGGNGVPDKQYHAAAWGSHGGFYLGWDKVGRHINLWLKRGKNHGSKSMLFDPVIAVQDPDAPMNQAWEWYGSAILLKLRRPEVNLLDVR